MIDSLYCSDRKFSQRRENSFANYGIHYQKLCDLMRQIAIDMNWPCAGFQHLDLYSTYQILSSSIMTFVVSIFIRYWFLESRCSLVLVPTYHLIFILFFESRYPLVLVPTDHLLFPFVLYSWCIVVFNFYRQLTNEKWRVREWSSTKSTKKTNPFSPLKTSISIVVYKDS